MRPSPLLPALLALAALCPAAPAANAAPRNVLLLVADDLGLQVCCYGDPKAKTPNIDALAKNGTRFSHAFATVSSCSPSRASIYTGLYTHTSGQYGLAHAAHNFHTRDNVKSLPRLLRDAGYRTGIVGKVHVLPQKVYPFEVEVTRNLGGNRNVAAMAREARKFFVDSGDKPFLLVMGFADPHRAGRGFANDASFPGVKKVPFGPADVTLPYYLPDQPDARRDLADYYQAVSRLDQGVSLTLDALKETGKAGHTLVIFLSDNGPPFPGAKTTLYDAGIRLPLIVSSPAQKRRGLTCNGMVSWTDVMPTVLDWAGVKGPALPGRSFLPLLEQESPKGWDKVYGSHQFHEVTMYYPMRMVRDRHYKYIRNLAHPLDYPFASDLYDSPTWQGIRKRGDKFLGKRSVEQFVRRPPEELYDLDTDPNELKNLANDPSPLNRAVRAALRADLEAWQVGTNDPWLIKYRHE